MGKQQHFVLHLVGSAFLLSILQHWPVDSLTQVEWSAREIMGLGFFKSSFRGPVAPNWRASCFVVTEKPAPGELNLASVGGQYADLQRILGMTVMHALGVSPCPCAACIRFLY